MPPFADYSRQGGCLPPANATQKYFYKADKQRWSFHNCTIKYKGAGDSLKKIRPYIATIAFFVLLQPRNRKPRRGLWFFRVQTILFQQTRTTRETLKTSLFI